MNVFANPPMGGADSSFAAVLAALEPHADKALVFEYDAGKAQAGYQMTKVKAGSFVTIYCGGSPDACQETILHVEDVPSRDGCRYMPVGKCVSILVGVDQKVRLNDNARLHRARIAAAAACCSPATAKSGASACCA